MKFTYFETKTWLMLAAQPLTYDMYALIELYCRKVQSVDSNFHTLQFSKLNNGLNLVHTCPPYLLECCLCWSEWLRVLSRKQSVHY